MKFLQLGLVFVISSAFACNRTQPSPETVLSEGMKVSATTPSGKLIIECGKGLTRKYQGENWSKTSELIPRTSRWSGSLGLYDPAGSDTLGDRLLLEEGRQFFSSESEAMRYLQTINGFYGAVTYSNDGLVVAYSVTAIPNEKPTRDIQLWQIYINGAKPKALRGASNLNIKIEGGTILEQANPTPAPIGYERKISDKEYAPM